MGAYCSSPVDEDGVSVHKITKSLQDNGLDDEYAQLQKTSFMKSNRNLAKSVLPVQGGEGGELSPPNTAPMSGSPENDQTRVSLRSGFRNTAVKARSEITLKTNRSEDDSLAPLDDTGWRRGSTEQIRSATAAKARTMTQHIGMGITGITKMASSINMGSEVKVDHEARITSQLNEHESEKRGMPGQHFVRNRWGALKNNLNDVVLAEKRRTVRGGMTVTVDEDGDVCSDEENKGGKGGGGSPANNGQAQAAMHNKARSNPNRGSFSDSRFAKNVKQARQNNSKNNSAAKLKKMRAQAMKRGRHSNTIKTDSYGDFKPIPDCRNVKKPWLYYKWNHSGLKLNIFGAYYGFVAISLGFIWFATLKSITAFTYLTKKLTGKDVDVNKGWGIRVNAVWGWFVLRLTGCWPLITGKRRVQGLLRGRDDNGKGVMYVANHCSWMDIPYVAMAIGIRKNYKIIAKSSLLKVPILSTAITTGSNIPVDRSNRRSQVETYKSGISWLNKGVGLCTFPEGTRSEDGRMGEFKRGAFKMALTTGAPIVPISISYSNVLNPKDWVFPLLPARGIPVRVHVGRPVETEGREEGEVVEEVRRKINSGLGEAQKSQD